MQVERKLKAKIIEKFGSQADFAPVIKEDETVISRIVRGRRRLSSEQKQRWAKVLGCDPEEIFEK